MSRVFISYSTSDLHHAQRIHALLNREGIDCWFAEDTQGIKGGDVWRDRLKAELEQSFAVIIIVTNSSLKSHWVTFEWSRSEGMGIPLIPLVFEAKIAPSVAKKNPLEQIQAIHCSVSIPEDKILSRVYEFAQKSLPMRFVEHVVLIDLLPFRVLMTFYVWLQSIEHPSITNRVLRQLLELSHQELSKCIELSIPRAWVTSAHAFTLKQKSVFTKIATELELLFYTSEFLYTTGVHTDVDRSDTRLFEIDGKYLSIIWTECERLMDEFAYLPSVYGYSYLRDTLFSLSRESVSLSQTSGIARSLILVLGGILPEPIFQKLRELVSVVWQIDLSEVDYSNTGQIRSIPERVVKRWRQGL